MEVHYTIRRQYRIFSHHHSSACSLIASPNWYSVESLDITHQPHFIAPPSGNARPKARNKKSKPRVAGEVIGQRTPSLHQLQVRDSCISSPVGFRLCPGHWRFLLWHFSRLVFLCDDLAKSPTGVRKPSHLRILVGLYALNLLSHTRPIGHGGTARTCGH